MNVQDLINAYGLDILVILKPHISGNHAEHVISQVGLPRHFQVDLIGLSSGIWVLWDNHKCNVDVVQATKQSVAMIIKVPYSSQYTPWLFSAIYASPILHKCMHIWTYLKNVASKYNMPRLVMGDFNEILDTTDKIGGQPLIASHVYAFHECLNQCSHFDLITSGPNCIWTNKNWDRRWRWHIREKLDRAFINAEWQVLFPKGHCLTLPRFHSDHCPIIMSTEGWERHSPIKQLIFNLCGRPTLFSINRSPRVGSHMNPRLWVWTTSRLISIKKFTTFKVV